MDSKPTVECDLQRVIAEIGIDESQIIALTLVGSRLHKTALPDSDYDFIAVVKDETELKEGKKIERDFLDVTIFTRSEYKQKIEEGTDWQTTEPLWAPKEFKWISKEDFTQYYAKDLMNLRTAVSSIASKGYAYAKILMTKEQNFQLAKKNLAHGIRNLRLGIQLIKYGEIVDYSESKELFEEIMAETSEDWSYYHEKWCPIVMTHQREFIALTPQKIKPPKPPRKRKNRANDSAQPSNSEES